MDRRNVTEFPRTSDLAWRLIWDGSNRGVGHDEDRFFWSDAGRTERRCWSWYWGCCSPRSGCWLPVLPTPPPSPSTIPVDPGDGDCNPNGGCTLREAINEANATTADTIRFDILWRRGQDYKADLAAPDYLRAVDHRRLQPAGSQKPNSSDHGHQRGVEDRAKRRRCWRRIGSVTHPGIGLRDQGPGHKPLRRQQHKHRLSRLRGKGQQGGRQLYRHRSFRHSDPAQRRWRGPHQRSRHLRAIPSGAADRPGATLSPATISRAS